MRSIFHKTICLIQVLSLLYLTGCGLPGGLRKGSKGRRSPSVLKSSDGACQVTLPAGWDEKRDLHDSAELEAANESEEMYVIILQESKEDFQKMTIDQHSEITRGTLEEALTAPQVQEPTRSTIDGYPALQSEIRGAAENINVVYLHTTVETEKKYYQILAWTLSSKFMKNRSKLQEVVQSFHEIN